MLERFLDQVVIRKDDGRGAAEVKSENGPKLLHLKKKLSFFFFIYKSSSSPKTNQIIFVLLH
jgi:hypothetical protein